MSSKQNKRAKKGRKGGTQRPSPRSRKTTSQWQPTGYQIRKSLQLLPLNHQRAIFSESSYKQYIQSVMDPISGPARLPIYDSAPSVTCTLMTSGSIVCDAVHATDGVAFIPSDGSYHDLTPTSPGVGTWGALTAMTGLSSLVALSKIRFVSAGIYLQYVGNTTETQGSFTVVVFPISFSVPTSLNGTYGVANSKTYPLGKDYFFPIQGYDNSSEEYVNVTAGPLFSVSGVPALALIFNNIVSKTPYRFTMVGNYEVIPYSSSTSFGAVGGFVQGHEPVMESLPANTIEAIRDDNSTFSKRNDRVADLVKKQADSSASELAIKIVTTALAGVASYVSSRQRPSRYAYANGIDLDDLELGDIARAA